VYSKIQGGSRGLSGSSYEGGSQIDRLITLVDQGLLCLRVEDDSCDSRIRATSNNC